PSCCGSSLTAAPAGLAPVGLAPAGLAPAGLAPAAASSSAVSAHWCRIVAVGVSASARRPTPMASNRPSSVLPDPGGATMCTGSVAARESRTLSSCRITRWERRNSPVKDQLANGPAGTPQPRLASRSSLPWAKAAMGSLGWSIALRLATGAFTPPGERSVVHGLFVAHVPDRLELEGAVGHVEVPVEAIVQRIEGAAPELVVHLIGVDHHVCREHRHSAGDGPGVQVVHVNHAGQGEHVFAHLCQVHVLR